MTKIVQIFAIIMLLGGCTDRDTSIDKRNIRSSDYRLFQGTKAWVLAKAVDDGDVDKIKDEIRKDKGLLNFRGPRFGQPLLEMAVMHKNYRSVQILLELGADPN